MERIRCVSACSCAYYYYLDAITHDADRQQDVAAPKEQQRCGGGGGGGHKENVKYF